jgi:hypothetical protein
MGGTMNGRLGQVAHHTAKINETSADEHEKRKAGEFPIF